MLRSAGTANRPLGFFVFSLANIVSSLLAAVLTLVMTACGGTTQLPDAAPAQPGVVSQDAQSWYILYSEGTADHPQPISSGAWNLPLPTAGHVNYVLTPYRTTVRPQQIVLSYRVVTSPGAIPISYEAAASPCREHNPCTPVAEFHVFFEQRGDDMAAECGRWWYKPGFRLTDVPNSSYTVHPFVADGQPHTVTIPLNADSWTSVTGKGSAGDFDRALKNAGYVGVTFGGTDFFGHGVVVTHGMVQFEMIDYRVE